MRYGCFWEMIKKWPFCRKRKDKIASVQFYNICRVIAAQDLCVSLPRTKEDFTEDSALEEIERTTGLSPEGKAF